MRLGGQVFEKTTDPQGWVAAVKRLGYRAAYCPIDAEADDDTVGAYAAAAAEADILIAEVGAWSNPISPDEGTRREALAGCIRQLTLAERIGARCCVNIAGSRGAKWAGPHPENFSDATFDLIVQTVRQIIDAVRPARTSYTLEMMQWVHPDSAETYLDIIRAVDRRSFGVHIDPVNLINSPRRYYENARLLEHTVRALSAHIRSCHAKDVHLSDEAIVHLTEVRPGSGGLDYGTYLRELAKLDPDTPIMLEHLSSAEEYDAAAAHLRAVAAKEGVTL